MSELNGQILFFLSALGAFNGILLSIYLFIVRGQKLAYLLLSALLLAISVRVGKSVFFYFSPDLDKLFLQIGLSACFLIGPLLYFFCSAITKKISRHKIDWKVHLAILAAVIVIFGLTYPYESFPELWGGYVYKLVNWTWFVYILLAAQYVYPGIKQLVDKTKPLNKDALLLQSVFSGVSIIWLAYAFASYTSYILGALSFSFSLYLSALLFIWHLRSSKEEKYIDKKIDNATAEALFARLQQLMAVEKVYRDPGLTLAKLARKLGVSASTLSQLLNDNLQKSFAIFLNEYRVAEAKALLAANEQLNMENIADRCGYNSLSTFYTAFKKIEKVPPAKFRQMGC